MATIKDYPVSFPYGATTAPYSPSNPHKGDDRAAPAGTPIVISGTNIGLVGSTGFSTGNHLHIQKISNGQVVNPRGGGLDIKGEVYETGTRNDIGNYVRIRDTSGNLWSYFHLSKINVSKGARIGEEKDMITSEGQLRRLFLQFTGKEPSKEDYKGYIGKRTYAYTISKLNAVRKDLPNLIKQLNDCQAGGTKLTKGKYYVE